MRIQPKIKDMTEDELKAWKDKLKRMEFESISKDAYNKISGGRGWIF
jgi:hypothetical protein